MKRTVTRDAEDPLSRESAARPTGAPPRLLEGTPEMEPTEAFVSKLPKGAARFLAEALEHALLNGRRTPDDFIRHFPPGAIMASLDAEPKIRATFLVTLLGLKERTALRTSSADAGRMLENALAEGDTDAAAVVGSWSPDDRIRFLDARRVWTFLLEGEFWKAPRSKDGGVYRVAQAHLAFMLDRALAHHLVSHENVVEGITIDVIAEKLPRNDLARVFKGAVVAGRSGKPFNDGDLYGAITAATLVDYVPLPHIMASVLAPMALAAGFVEVVTVPKPHVGKPANGESAESAVEAWPDSIPAS
jgi:hypothetical protein